MNGSNLREVQAFINKLAETSPGAKEAVSELRQKVETSKKLAYWAAGFFTFIVIAVLVLDALQIPISPEAFAVVKYALVGCFTIVSEYYGTKTFEKLSRNKHRLDADGNPISFQNTEGDGESGE